MLYRATANLSGGQQIQSEAGSFDDCAKWAEDVIRANGGDITVRILRIPGGTEQGK